MEKRPMHGADALKRTTASTIDKGSGSAIPMERWQMDVGASVFARGYGDDPAGAFLARPGKDRARPHIKVNECDH